MLVTGGARENNGNGGYVTNPEIWDPNTGNWTEVVIPQEHARLYHSTALLLPDGRVMVGGGAPGPRNYTDVEYYSPNYLFDGNNAAPRPVISAAPAKIGYNGSFQITATGTVSRVTLLRNGSVTHGFNNDQNFQELAFSQSGGTVTITSPLNGNYAPPGSYMLHVFDAAGTPSVAKLIKIDPAVIMTQLNPRVVDQFEYPRLPAEWRTNNPPATVDVAAGNSRMVPWAVDSQVQLVRGNATGQGGLGFTGYQLALGATGNIRRTVSDLTPGATYRLSLRYARDARAAGTAAATGTVAIGSLNATITATTAQPSTAAYGTYVGTFTAATANQTLTLRGTAVGLMVDDLVIVGDNAPPPATGIPVRYEFEEGTGTTAANTGSVSSVGAAVLTGTAGWSANGVIGKAVNLPGGSTANAVDLPDNLLQGAVNFSTGFWVRPDVKNNWTGLFHIGDGLGSAGSYYQIQMQTQANGSTGLAVTFKAKTGPEERVYASPAQDVVAGQWNHVAFTRQGSIGTLYLNGVVIATRTDLTIGMTEIGPTANNWLGRNGYGDAAFDGLIDDVRVYPSALTSADIVAMYNEGVSVRYTFDENTGDVGVGGNTTANFIGGTSWGDDRFDGLIDDFRLYGYELSADHVTQLYAGRR
ncbi:hypothetical protein F4553_003038 [Allocatelliglobosispora scoriae]|uniref:LamG-like jellyroll fold domain-containing protein n=1 Tax=Allocatelliglobosispora scoriae TaxID=643052 RepID=A0A841BR37_9ACTN|nr:LamG-like jellyroll fold domain-containing protein [Allocatelliglobosispora scoriae]MBB5869659.1 hypothetical protein [Allocatelliglobosispora scoriae]